jgi:transposase
METIIERAAGLDVHQATVVAGVLIGKAGGRPRKEVRTFGTMTKDLEALRDWLRGFGVTHVGMESTGVYWMPVYTVLTGHFTLIVGNPSSGIPAATRPEPLPASPITSRMCRDARPM